MTTQHDDDASHIEATHAHEHDDHSGGGHGHGADPNAGVIVATPPTPAWVLTAAGIGLVTIIVSVVLAVMLHNAADDAPSGPPAHGRAAATLTVAGS